MKGVWGWASFNADHYLSEIRQFKDYELKAEHEHLREQLLDMGAMLKLPMVETVLAEAVTKKIEAERQLIKSDLPTSSYRDRAILHAKYRLRLAEAKAAMNAAQMTIWEIEKYEDALPEGVDGWMTEAGWR
jgi:hypothetical protein